VEAILQIRTIISSLVIEMLLAGMLHKSATHTLQPKGSITEIISH